VPNARHLDPVLGGAGRRPHVFSEKPLADHAGRRPEDLAAASSAKSIYQIGFNRRFANVYRFARERIADGRLVPHVAQMKHNRGELQQPAWTGDASVTGGYLYETPGASARHGAVFCLARCGRWPAWRGQSVTRSLDGFALVLTFHGGVVATVTSSRSRVLAVPSERVEIYGTTAPS